MFKRPISGQRRTVFIYILFYVVSVMLAGFIGYFMAASNGDRLFIHR